MIKSFTGTLLKPLYRQYYLLKWRQKHRKNKTVRLKVQQVAKVLEQFEQRDIPYVVLRWFEEVPLTVQQEQSFHEDVDLLIEPEKMDQIAELAGSFRGKMKCDLYSTTAKLGTSYLGMPYYPPVMAQEILAQRVKYKDQFYIPCPLHHFNGLAYHLVYHKGLESGIPSGCKLTTNPAPKRPYQQKLEELGEKLQIPLPQPYTLLALHEYLKSVHWDMPYDLLERWPRQNDWQRFLIEREKTLLQPWAEKLPQLAVFFLRSDIVDAGAVEEVYTLLEQKFTLLEKQQLNHEQQRRVMRMVRGGNWIEHKRTTVVPPCIAVVAYDFAPQDYPSDDPRQKRYPLVTNINMFYKHEVRTALNQSYPQQRKIIGLHGSDNAYEAQHMLEAVYGSDTPTMNQQLLERVSI
ncbi:MAG: hypothetical protein J7K75_13370 [Desulfuromonas sp.]|nr:hypothetical protein [Desulfuromonas sp.]